ncbi:MAG: leucine-rich repeat protein, partial [Ruminococcus sp.]|nr:leucine-rich repeat protein [Ruminococcus sp.]
MKKRALQAVSILLSLLMIAAIIPAMPVFAADTDVKPTAEDIDPTTGTWSVVGNGGTEGSSVCGNNIWMHGAKWDPAEESNLMTKIADDMNYIAFLDLPKGDNYQFKYVWNKTWDPLNYGNDFIWDSSEEGRPHAGSGQEQFLTEYGSNFIVNIPYDDATTDIRMGKFEDGWRSKITIYNSSGEPLNGYGSYQVYGDFWYNNSVIVRYTGTEKNVVIPERINGKKITAIGGSAFAGCSDVETVKLSNSVVMVSPYAFLNCTSLKSIDMPKVSVVGARAFKGCTSLKTVNFSDGINKIDDEAFSGCGHLTIGGTLFTEAYYFAQDNGYDFVPEEKNDGIINVKYDVYNLKGTIVRVSSDSESFSREIVYDSNDDTDNSSWTVSGLSKTDKYTVTVMTKTGRKIFEKKDVIAKSNGTLVNIDVPTYSCSVFFNDWLWRIYLRMEESVYSYSLEWYVNDQFEEKQYIYYLDYIAEMDVKHSIDHLKKGDKVKCVVTLEDRYTDFYYTPEPITTTIENNNFSYYRDLESRERYKTTITVTDNMDNPLRDADVNIVQRLENNYNKTYSLKTDKNGEVSLELTNSPTDVKVSKFSYVKSSKTFTPDGSGLSIKLNRFSGKDLIPDIVGEKTDGSKSTILLKDLELGVKNLTTGEEITDYYIENGVVTILDTLVSEGDELELTFEDSSGVYKTASKKFNYSSSNKKIEVNLVEKGYISFSYLSENDDNIALLFDSDGEYADTVDLSRSQKSSHLDGDDYTVVMMGADKKLSNIRSYSELVSYGLENGKDFVTETVTVTTGKCSEVKDVVIPKLNLKEARYVSESASFVYINPTNVTMGNYVSVVGSYALIENLDDNVQAKSVSFEVPKQFRILDGVLLNGASIDNYKINGNTISIPVSQSSGVVRFCALPEAFVDNGVIKGTVVLND